MGGYYIMAADGSGTDIKDESKAALAGLFKSDTYKYMAINAGGMGILVEFFPAGV